jgi:hypothetical protein
MIQFLTPAILMDTPPPRERHSFWARWWRRRNPARIHARTPTTEILDIIDRVRGAEAQLQRLKGASCVRG